MLLRCSCCLCQRLRHSFPATLVAPANSCAGLNCSGLGLNAVLSLPDVCIPLKFRAEFLDGCTPYGINGQLEREKEDYANRFVNRRKRARQLSAGKFGQRHCSLSMMATPEINTRQGEFELPPAKRMKSTEAVPAQSSGNVTSERRSSLSDGANPGSRVKGVALVKAE